MKKDSLESEIRSLSIGTYSLSLSLPLSPSVIDFEWVCGGGGQDDDDDDTKRLNSRKWENWL